MQSAGARERQIAIGNGQVCSDGIPWITVYLDGSWSKRSYGTTALSGMVGIIGKNTGEVIFVGVRNKFCSICMKNRNKDHICYKNWDGSAPAMEANSMVVEAFTLSESMHGVRYCKFIADGDSCIFARIKQCVPYGNEVKKVECTNHAIKNYGKRLRSIKKDTQINIKGRKLLTNSKIDLLTKRTKTSIYEHAKKHVRNIEVFKQNLRFGLHHVFGDHEFCRTQICNTVGDQDNYFIPELKVTNIYSHLNGKY